MKLLTILGTRPQFITAATLSRAMHNSEACTDLILHTGQHYDSDMSDAFFEELKIIPPQYHLGIGGGTHGQNTGRMIEKIEEVLLQHNPLMSFLIIRHLQNEIYSNNCFD